MAGCFTPDWETALSLQDRGHAREALRHFRAIGQQQVAAGNALPALLETARRMCLLYDYGNALPLLEAAARLASHPSQILLKIALLLRQENLFAEAAAFATRVIAQGRRDAADLDARLILAECLERLGRLEESLACCDEVLQTHPGSIPAHRQRATVLRRTGRLEEALACLSPLTTRGAPPHWETCRAWFEWGHLQEAAGDPAAAWHAWTQARKHYPPAADWNLYRQQARHVWQHVGLLHENVTAGHLKKWVSAADPAAPRHAILTGHPRSGTTLLEQALDAHNRIVSAEETTIFTSAVYRPLFQHGPPGRNPADYLDHLTPRELRHWQEEYHGLTSLALRGRPCRDLLLDKNPDLLQLLPAALRILPGTRLIVMLRDPRDILVSMFSLALPPNHTSWSYRTIQTAAEMIALRLGWWIRLREMLPPACFHEIRYENAVLDFPGSVRRALDFLGCPQQALPADPAGQSHQRIVQSPTYAAVQEPVHSRAVGRWQRYEPWLAPALPHLDPVLAALGY